MIRKLPQAFGLIGPVLLALSALIIAGAWFTQIALGWPPCGLCLIQRMPHYWNLAIGLPLLIAAFALPKYRAALIAITGLVALVCYLVALYWSGFHSGVELGWWPGLDSCSGGSKDALSATDLFTAPVIDCTKPQPMFPVVAQWPSMANSHFLLVGLAIVLSGRAIAKRW